MALALALMALEGSGLGLALCLESCTDYYFFGITLKLEQDNKLIIVILIN